ncbi:Type 1 glutamine amidotransferase-like domain-containing protein [Solibacillus silvestris]|uniref:Type 1 glutamine amidotransferase-like domain-containing protein n=1 Tax=Solibacillus silvestris TaxID=76853 RepID=UPI003F7E365B
MTIMDRHIIAISGGGFSEERDALIDQYILGLAQKSSSIRIAFVSTASNDSKDYIEKFHNAFQDFETTHITKQDFAEPDIQELVNAQTIIYVGGGNTKYMLDTWKAAGFDKLLKNAYRQGVILAGVSAGAMCWFEHCYSEVNGHYTQFEGLGLLKGAFCPHYEEPERKQLFNAWASTNGITPAYPLTDNENIHFKNEQYVMKLTSY